MPRVVVVVLAATVYPLLAIYAVGWVMTVLPSSALDTGHFSKAAAGLTWLAITFALGIVAAAIIPAAILTRLLGRSTFWPGILAALPLALYVGGNLPERIYENGLSIATALWVFQFVVALFAVSLLASLVGRLFTNVPSSGPPPAGRYGRWFMLP